MLYDVKTGWVFEMDKLQDFEYIEQFKFHFQELLQEKHQKLVDYLDPNDQDLDFSKEEIAPELETISPKEEEPKLNIEIPNLSSKIYIPKVRFPKIQVRIPNINKKNRAKLRG